MDNKVITQVQTFIKKHNLLPSGSTVILGLSGGPDSVFLLHFLADMHKKGEIKLIAVHLDHEWRPESARDVAFCQEITEKLGISFITSKASELDIGYELKGSQEELGRRLRRFF